MIELQDITPTKSELRVLIESYSNNSFYIDNQVQILSELGLLEIHKMDEKIMLLYNSGIKKNTNNGNSFISYLIGITTVPPSGPLVKKGGSLPD